MISQHEISQIIQERSKLHPDDPSTPKYWTKLTQILTQDLEETIELLNKASEDEVCWLSEIFDDLILHFQKNPKLTSTIKNLDKKFPSSQITQGIEKFLN